MNSSYATGTSETPSSASSIGTKQEREAGGYVTAIDGKPVRLDGRSFLAANDRVHGKLVSLFSAARPSG